MKVLLLGDVHGNLGHFTNAVEAAKLNGCCAVLQLGDFGFWEHTSPTHMDAVSDVCQYYDIPVIWVDGNHENHTLLRTKYGPGGPKYNPIGQGFHQGSHDPWWEIRDGVWYAPRASYWIWNDKKFLACGGAYSVDKPWRMPGESWWPEETITRDEADDCMATGLADVVVSHDAPLSGLQALADTGKECLQTDTNRRLLQEVCDFTRPSLLVHGHYHHRYTEHLGENERPCRIEGFGCDPTSNSMGVLRVESLTVAPINIEGTAWATTRE